MRSTILFAVNIFAIIILSQAVVNAHTPAPTPTPAGRTRPIDRSQVASATWGLDLPDLRITNIEFVGPNQGVGTARIKVTIANIATSIAFAQTATAKGPIKVWLRVWKPAKPQDLSETEPQATTFVWGGVLSTTDVRAGATPGSFLGFAPKELIFEVPTPPGGWEPQCTMSQGYFKPKNFCYFKNKADPLRLRIAARVDSGNAIKERDESNNDRVLN